MSSINDAYKKGTPELKGLSPSIAVRPTFLDGTKTAGLRDYELTDHLSNVMAVISDRKLSVDTNYDNITDYYSPQVSSFTDYYPFGFAIAERSGNLSGYRFGFNGQEGDNEVYGVKTTYAFEYRMQDTRLGRFWSVDPLARNYTWNSTYAFAENRVVDGIDLEGLEYYYAADGTLLWKHGTSTQVMRVNAEFVEKNKGKTVALKDLNANSTDVGMTNEELNTRAMLYTIRNTEAWGNKTLDYDDQFGGGKFGEGQTDEEKYKDHPRKAVTKWGKTSTASGAYMMRSATWDWIKGKIGANDFSPKNQDKGAVWLIKYRGALDLVKNGKIKEAFAKLKNEWTSFPGAKEEGMKQDDAMKTFKEGVSKELNGDSVIKTPKGELLTK